MLWRVEHPLTEILWNARPESRPRRPSRGESRCLNDPVVADSITGIQEQVEDLLQFDRVGQDRSLVLRDEYGKQVRPQAPHEGIAPTEQRSDRDIDRHRIPAWA